MTKKIALFSVFFLALLLLSACIPKPIEQIDRGDELELLNKSDESVIELQPVEAQLDILQVSKETAIRMLFAEKYDKYLSEISVSISQETDDHLRGMVDFAPGGPGNGGIFLAVKVGGRWKLVFDGNGVIYCDEMEEYNFPQEMIEDCFRE